MNTRLWVVVVVVVFPPTLSELLAGRHPLALPGRPAPLAGRPQLLPAADGVRVLHDDLVHPGEGLREQHGPLEEAQVASVLRQGEDHVGHLLCEQREERMFMGSAVEKALKDFSSGRKLQLYGCLINTLCHYLINKAKNNVISVRYSSTSHFHKGLKSSELC